VAVCRELTKAHEEVVRGSAAELAERYRGEPPRGEVVLVIGPSETGAGSRAGSGGVPDGVDALARLVEAGAKVRPAAAVVAELVGESPNRLYRAYLEARKSTSG
jgi:16S rRNA (cytidine1402-2'-O)-methyltransferase